jgi:hypothetical protein
MQPADNKRATASVNNQTFGLQPNNLSAPFALIIKVEWIKKAMYL